MYPRSERLIKFTCEVIPTIQLKTAFENNFLSKEARFALEYCAASMAYPEVIAVLCDGCDSKNIVIKSYSWSAVTNSIMNLDPSYYDQIGEFKKLFQTLSNGLIASKSFEERESIKILKTIGKEHCKLICANVF